MQIICEQATAFTGRQRDPKLQLQTLFTLLGVMVAFWIQGRVIDTMGKEGMFLPQRLTLNICHSYRPARINLKKHKQATYIKTLSYTLLVNVILFSNLTQSTVWLRFITHLNLMVNHKYCVVNINITNCQKKRNWHNLVCFVVGRAIQQHSLVLYSVKCLVCLRPFYKLGLSNAWF